MFNIKSFKIDLKKIKLRIKIPRRDQDQPTEQRMSPKRIIITFGGVLAFVLIIVAIYGFFHTSQPEFCVTCHEMQPEVDSWRTSIHAEVPCASCHFTGPLPSLKQKTSLIGEIYSHFTGSYKTPLNTDSALSKQIGSDGCLKCHTPKRILTARKSLVFNKVKEVNIHELHLKKSVNCTTCHNRVGHNDLPGYMVFISMEGCFRCHGLTKAAIAPGKCDGICHDAEKFDVVPTSHKTGTWRIVDHSKAAKKDMTPCMMCHQKTFCRGCHGVEVPHTDKFKKDEHGSFGKKNPEVCRNCHRQADFCTACHHKGYVGPPGGWVFVHKNVVAKVGPAYCFNCHGPTFCAWCHVRGELQPKTKRLQRPESLE